MTAVHNTPFGDVVDTEDDLQPLVVSMFADACRAVKLVAAVMATAHFDAERMSRRAAEGWTTLSELADTLVRDHDLPFRSAHAVAARLISARESDRQRGLSELLADAAEAETGRRLTYADARLSEILSAPHFVAVRRTSGGPAPEETARAADASLRQLDADTSWWNSTLQSVRSAEERLAAACRAL
jgi:argininosuccinate lyase